MIAHNCLCGARACVALPISGWVYYCLACVRELFTFAPVPPPPAVAPAKCKPCNGMGKRYVWYNRRWVDYPCEACNGSRAA